MIRRAVEWVAGVFLWPFQALFMRYDDWHALGEWADIDPEADEALTMDDMRRIKPGRLPHDPDYTRGPAAMDDF